MRRTTNSINPVVGAIIVLVILGLLSFLIYQAVTSGPATGNSVVQTEDDDDWNIDIKKPKKSTNTSKATPPKSNTGGGYRSSGGGIKSSK